MLNDISRERSREAQSRTQMRNEIEDQYSSDDSAPRLMLFSDSEEEEGYPHEPSSDEGASESDEEIRVDGDVRQDSEDEVVVSGLAGPTSPTRMRVRTPSPISELSSRDADVDENSDAPIGPNFFSRSPSLVDSLELYDVSRNQDVPHHSLTLQRELRRDVENLMYRFQRVGIEDENNASDLSASSSPRFVNLGIQLLDRNAHSAEGLFGETSAEESDDSEDSDSNDSYLVNTEPATPWSAHPDAVNALFSTRTPIFRSSTQEQAGPSSSSSASITSDQHPASTSSGANNDKPSTPRRVASKDESTAEEVHDDDGPDLRGRGGWAPATGYSCPLCLETEEDISSIKCGHVFCTAYASLRFAISV